MKKNLYFRYVYKSTQAIEAVALGAALRVLSFPRTLLDVFIRKNMGERFFSIGNALLMLIVLAYIPYGYRYEIDYFSMIGRMSTASFLEVHSIMSQQDFDRYNEFDWGNFIVRNGTWYLFLVAFGYQCLQRRKEIKRLPSVFDLGRSSVDPGKIHPIFEKFKWNGKSFDLRAIETILEPLFFFVIGLVLILLKQMVGYLILLSSVGYWMSYRISYFQGDQFIMDTIDEMLFSREKANAFISDKDSQDANGVRYYGRKPADPDTRRKVAEMFDDDDELEVN